MKPIHVLGGALAFALSACVPQPKSTPPVQTRPTPTPVPMPVPTTTPAPTNWMDAPQTAGDWSYRTAPGGGTALFGEPNGDARFSLRCDAPGRSVVLSRAGEASGATRMVVRTESQARTLSAAAANSALPAIEARLAATDRLLDAMALSKGRFAIEVPGTPTLYLPSWAEVTRVIEDCR